MCPPLLFIYEDDMGGTLVEFVFKDNNVSAAAFLAGNNGKKKRKTRIELGHNTIPGCIFIDHLK